MSRHEMTPESFAQEICSALPEGVQSIILFGSAAAGDFVPGTSDYDLFVVFDQVTALELAALAPVIQRWYRHGNSLPLLFSADQVLSSVDTFATEFLEMKQSRRILFGTDPIADMEIDLNHVRIHLERELKGKLLALRNRYTLAHGHPRQLQALLSDSFSTFLSLFRVALRMYQPEVPTEKLQALQVLSTYVFFNVAPFMAIDELREQRRKWKSVDPEALFRDYSEAIEVIVNAIDQKLHPIS